jgi:30S ribosomal protein 3
MSCEFSYRIIWLDISIGIAVDKKLGNNIKAPITSFYFWPRVNGWDLLKHELSLKPWLLEEERIKILNDYTKIIYIWKNCFKNIELINFVELEKNYNFTLSSIEY